MKKKICRKILMGSANPLNFCSFCGQSEDKLDILFISPSGATMCSSCLVYIKAEMKKPIEKVEPIDAA